jgi:hypothetical protein
VILETVVDELAPALGYFSVDARILVQDLAGHRIHRGHAYIAQAVMHLQHIFRVFFSVAIEREHQIEIAKTFLFGQAPISSIQAAPARLGAEGVQKPIRIREKLADFF